MAERSCGKWSKRYFSILSVALWEKEVSAAQGVEEEERDDHDGLGTSLYVKPLLPRGCPAAIQLDS